MSIWNLDEWRWKLANRCRVQHMYAPWTHFEGEAIYRKRCESISVVARFKPDTERDTKGKCKKCLKYDNAT